MMRKCVLKNYLYSVLGIFQKYLSTLTKYFKYRPVVIYNDRDTPGSINCIYRGANRRSIRRVEFPGTTGTSR